MSGRRGARRRSGDSCRGTVLLPAVAAAAELTGATAVGLVSLWCSAGFDLLVDRVGVRYDDGLVLGDPSSPVQLEAAVKGERPVPPRALPEVVARTGLDPEPLDAADPGGARWLRACLAPDDVERRTSLDAQLALLAAEPPLLLRGDPGELLPEALATVPPPALPVVTTTWALSRSSPARRQQLLSRLQEAADGRAVAWVSVEGVGVAPAVPSLGDRPASGHSMVGLVVLDGAASHGEVLARCWGRGRWVGWLADA